MLPTYARVIFAAAGALCCSLVSTAQSLLTVEVSPPSEGTVFEQDSTGTRIVTDAESLEIVGKVQDPFLDLLLLESNGREFIQYPRNQAFKMVLPLEKGINSLDAKGYDGTKFMPRMEIIRLNPFRLLAIEQLAPGGDPLVTQFGDEGHPEGTVHCALPEVRILFDSGAPDTADLRILDEQGLPLAVESQNDLRTGIYVLQEGANSLTIQSVYDGRVYHEMPLSLSLQPLLSLSREELGLKDLKMVIESGPKKVVTPLTEIPIRGMIPAIKTGTIIASVGSVSETLPIVNHEYQWIAPLESGTVNTLRISTSIGDREFSDTMEIEQLPYVIDWQNIRSTALRGNSIDTAGPLVGTRAAGYRTRSPILQLEGRSSYNVELSGILTNRSNDETVEVVGSPQNIRASIRLSAGENKIDYTLIDGEFSILVDQLTVWLDDPIIVDNINGKLPTDTLETAESSSLTLSGRIPFIQRGNASLNIGDREYSLQVTGGTFETSEPVELTPGILNEVQISFMVMDNPYSTTIAVMAPEKPTPAEEAALAQIPVIEDGGTTATTATRKPVIVEPVARRMLEPKLVRDPLSDTLIKGRVTIQFLIDARGRVQRSSVDVLDSSNVLLNEEAIQTIARWTFTPATVDGVPTNRLTRITMIWK
jgi:TonB family protein